MFPQLIALVVCYSSCTLWPSQLTAYEFINGHMYANDEGGKLVAEFSGNELVLCRLPVDVYRETEIVCNISNFVSGANVDCGFNHLRLTWVMPTTSSVTSSSESSASLTSSIVTSSTTPVTVSSTTTKSGTTTLKPTSTTSVTTETRAMTSQVTQIPTRTSTRNSSVIVFDSRLSGGSEKDSSMSTLGPLLGAFVGVLCVIIIVVVVAKRRPTHQTFLVANDDGLAGPVHEYETPITGAYNNVTPYATTTGDGLYAYAGVATGSADVLYDSATGSLKAFDSAEVSALYNSEETSVLYDSATSSLRPFDSDEVSALYSSEELSVLYDFAT